jgi:hypothetical protein
VLSPNAWSLSGATIVNGKSAKRPGKENLEQVYTPSKISVAFSEKLKAVLRLYSNP